MFPDVLVSSVPQKKKCGSAQRRPPEVYSPTNTTTTTPRTAQQQKENDLHRPGIEPGASRIDLRGWQRLILPLNHRC